MVLAFILFIVVVSIDTAVFGVPAAAEEAEASVLMIVTAPRALVTTLWLLVMVVPVAI